MKTNYLAVAACVLVNMGLGMSWYGIFAKPWMEGHGLTMETIEKNVSATPYIATAVAAVVSGLILSHLFQKLNVVGWMEGAKTGALIGLLPFVSTVASYLFSQKSLGPGVLDGGYMLVLYALYGAVIGGWQKKA
jgi:ABC-type enterochelin transport system permease subunit